MSILPAILFSSFNLSEILINLPLTDFGTRVISDANMVAALLATPAYGEIWIREAMASVFPIPSNA